MIVLKQFVSLIMAAMENGKKRIISVIIVTIAERSTSSKTWILILYIRTTTNILTGYALKKEKYLDPQAKNYFYILWLPPTILLLKQKPPELEEWFSTLWKLEISMMYTLMHALLFQI